MHRYSRGYLPHIEIPDGTYFVTFRLSDSLPQKVLVRFQQERSALEKSKAIDPLLLLRDYESKIQKFLDASYGCCWLRNPAVAKVLVEALKKNDQKWYVLHAYTIMPNHVHALFSIIANGKLAEIMRNWKGASSFYSNRILQRSGVFWEHEYFERLIRSRRHFEFCIIYIFRNPVKAGLCAGVFQWPWTRASPEIHAIVKRFFMNNEPAV